MPFYRTYTRKNRATGRNETVKTLYVRWPDENGKWHQCPAIDFGIADIKAAKAWEATRKSDPSLSKPQVLDTLDKLLGEYLSWKAGEGKSIERQSYCAISLLNHFGEDKLPSDISSEDIKNFIKIRRTEVSDGTIIKDLGLLSAAWNRGLKNNWRLPPNPVDGNKPKRPDHREVFITREQYADLIKAARQAPKASYLAPAIIVAVNCGLRKG